MTAKSRVRLHVRRMFITDEADLLPPFLRFVQGVVDTEDLPLNVSREMLQSTPVLARIRKAVTNRVISELRTRAKDTESYAGFWENFGPVLKEGLWEDFEHRTELAALARFHSTHEPKTLTALADYVARMKPEQDAIYYLIGDNEDALAGSPQLEGFRARGIEVLLLSDPVDAFWPDRLDKFEDKPLRSVTQGLADLSKHSVETPPGAEAADVTALLSALKEALGEDVSEVRSTDRLVNSAVVLSASQAGPDLQLQRMMRRSGQKLPSSAPILEINPHHALVRALVARIERHEPVEEAARTLLDLARGPGWRAAARPDGIRAQGVRGDGGDPVPAPPGHLNPGRPDPNAEDRSGHRHAGRDRRAADLHAGWGAAGAGRRRDRAGGQPPAARPLRTCLCDPGLASPGHLSFASAHPGSRPFEVVGMPYGPQVLWPDHAIQGTRNAALHPALDQHRLQMILRKGTNRLIDSYSAFSENDRVTSTGLAGWLRGRGVRRLFFCGLATDYCVAWSAEDAVANGFEAVVLEDACRGIGNPGPDGLDSLALARERMAAAGVMLRESSALG